MMRITSSLLLTVFFCLTIQAQKNDSIKARELQEVKVSASHIPATSQAGSPLQIMTEKDFLSKGIQSVSDAVKHFNGVVLKDYGGLGGLKTVSIRGMGAEYTSVSYDGVLVNNMQAGQVDIGRFTLDNISLLSLSIGQADNIFQTAKYFSSAGALNLQTRKPTFINTKHRAHLKVTAGSFGHFEPMIDYAYKLSNKASISTNVNWQRADGMYPYKMANDLNPNRKRINSDTDILRAEVNLFTALSAKDFLDAKLYFYNSQRGLPRAVVHTTIDHARERLWDKNAFAQLSYNRTFSEKVKFKSQAKYDFNYTKYREDIVIADNSNTYKLHEIYWTNSALYTLLPSLSFSLAQDLAYNSLRAEFARSMGGTPPQPNRYSSFTALAAQYKLDWLTITANGLFTYVREKANNGEDDSAYRKFSPTISASVKPLKSTNLRLRASFKHIYRIPTFNELYYVSTGTSLKAESSKQYNIGATWLGSIRNTMFDYISLSVDGYYNDVKDKIVITPQLVNPRSYNVGKVEMKGVDAKIATNLKLHEKLNLDIMGVYSYIEAYDTEKQLVNNTPNPAYKKQLIYTPKHSGSASLTINNPWVNLTYSVLFSDIRYYGKENLTTEELNSYTDHSITLFKELRVNKYTLYANGSINNLMNKHYFVINSYPMPGCSFKITVGCKF